MDKDIQVLTEENSITADDNVAEFLMADYFVSLFYFFICALRLQRGACLQATDSFSDSSPSKTYSVITAGGVFLM